MTVRELIEELEGYPMDLPVCVDYKEITQIDINESHYYMDDSYPTGYVYTAAVVLE